MREPFDLLVLDVSAKSFAPAGLCAALRNEPATRHTPMIFLREWATPHALVEELRQFSPADVICKPIVPPAK